MGEDSKSHPTSIALSRTPLAEVDAGTAIVLQVTATCAHGCDLRGRAISVVAPDGQIAAASDLLELTGHVNETAEFTVRTPDEVGDCSWTLVLPKHEADGVVHEESTLPVTVRTIPHETSLAVWGVPSPVVMNGSFRVHVGATCSAGCDLAGKEIEVCDETGVSVARAHLGELPWDGTRALYWTEIDLIAPGTEGSTSRSISFAPAELLLPHGCASARFGFETVKPPQHVVTVKIVLRDANTPVEDAQVRIGVYFGYSDQSGVARVALPQGTYYIDVLKTGYATSSRDIQVTSDVSIDIELAALPSVNYDEYWLFDPSKRL